MEPSTPSSDVPSIVSINRSARRSSISSIKQHPRRCRPFLEEHLAESLRENILQLWAENPALHAKVKQSESRVSSSLPHAAEPTRWRAFELGCSRARQLNLFSRARQISIRRHLSHHTPFVRPLSYSDFEVPSDECAACHASSSVPTSLPSLPPKKNSFRCQPNFSDGQLSRLWLSVHVCPRSHK